MMKNKSIILLSGGLDSVVSLALAKDFCSDILAITFNYGQKSFKAEKRAAEAISSYYKISHTIVDLPWLAAISTSSLNTSDGVPVLSLNDLNDISITSSSSNSVWVPNRNGLFINIAATFAEAKGYDSIVIGANSEEAVTFKDNSIDFITAINSSLENSLNAVVKVIAPLIDATKEDIVRLGQELEVPFELIHSCYVSNDNHCGNCESCLRLKRAFEQNNAYSLIEKLF